MVKAKSSHLAKGVLYIIALVICMPYVFELLKNPTYLVGPEAYETFQNSPLIPFALLFPLILGLAIIELLEAFEKI